MPRPSMPAPVQPTAGNEDGRTVGVSPLSSPFDGLNRQIVRLLEEDGRAAHDAIGRTLGVSGATVRHRVARMHGAGMLRIVAVDYEADAMPGVGTAPGIAPTTVAEPLSLHPAPVNVMRVGGGFDLPVEILRGEDTGIAAFLNGHVHGGPGIAHVEVTTRIGMFRTRLLLQRHMP